GIPNQLLGVQLHTIACSGLSRVRTELRHLLIVPSLAPHPVQTNGESAGHRDLGDLPPSPHRQVKILTAPLRIAAHCDLGRFHQQEAQQRAALFRDVSQPSPLSGRLLRRHQSQIARDLLAALKPLRSPDDQHEGQRRQRTDPGMRPQPLRLGTLFHFLLDRLRQLRNRGAQSVQYLKKIAPAPARPRCYLERTRLPAPACPPQLFLAAQAFVQRHRLQLVHDPRPRLHHPVTVPQQLPQISILPARYPDPRKAIFQQQSQNQLRVLAIRLLFAHPLRADLGGVPNPQLKPQLREQSFKPASVPTRFHPQTHAHSLRREIAIKLFRFLAVLQSPLLQFPGFGIHKRNLLEPRVVVTTYNHHVRLLSPGPWLVGTTKVYSGVGADIVMESIT